MFMEEESYMTYTCNEKMLSVSNNEEHNRYHFTAIGLVKCWKKTWIGIHPILKNKKWATVLERNLTKNNKDEVTCPLPGSISASRHLSE